MWSRGICVIDKSHWNMDILGCHLALKQSISSPNFCTPKLHNNFGHLYYCKRKKQSKEAIVIPFQAFQHVQ